MSQTTPDLPDWWRNVQSTSPHPPPTQVHTATFAGQTATGTLIGIPPVGEWIRVWAVSAGVIATAGTTGYIDCPVGNEHIICNVNQSLNLSFLPFGLLMTGSNVVVNTVGTIYYSITVVYDLTV